ncbi:O-ACYLTRANSFERASE (WSD1-LIKE) FAMILY PROTEIN [Salix koriyanagi]|uniref:O-ACYLTRANSFERASE (WSD1-LIKE) FAMILY PROTEIN n=1 Tax=Salix koriyanagi TaxID=2511006 RepID=A0A9Q0WCQ6_9ROSI|nr:O-ACYLTRANSFERASE (WSD1-LIKE) FAMILY PROTEIN [Salix koriyanagi]
MQPSRKAPYQETLVPPVLESVKTKDSAKWETREEMDMADSMESTGSQEPLSPAARLFHAPRFNCTILTAIGCKTSINPGVIKMGLEQTLMKHPRFSKKLVIDDNKCGSKLKWESTAVNVEDHIIEPDLDPYMDSPDQFVEDYISNLSSIPLDLSKPLWEMHILNVKTLDAEAIAVFRIHHSLGDGASLISLLLACTRQTSDPDALPSIPAQQMAGSHFSGGVWWLFFAIWTVLRLIWNTLVDLVLFLATMLYLEDTKTPLKGAYGVELKPKRFVHRTVSLDDIKLVKNAMNMTINDAIMGVTQAGLSRYLNRKYGDQSEIEDAENGKQNNIPKSIRLRASVLVNVRPTPGIQTLADLMANESNNPRWGWGNRIGYIILPFSIGLQDDPLEHIRKAKAMIDRKKLSLEATFSFHGAMLVIKLFGAKASAAMARRVVSNTTLAFSNVAGPVEEISFYGHPVAYIAPSVYGSPHALTIHFQSYGSKMTIAVAVDPDVIPDPHELCDDLEKSLEIIKDGVLMI